MTKIYFCKGITTLLMTLSLAVFLFAQTESVKDISNIKIKNFGQMDERFYRGAQPEIDDFAALKALGVNTVIDLRNDPKNFEQAAVENLGMKYVNIPMSGWKYPKAEYIEQFMDIMNDPTTGTVFVHCKAGKHRTGITGAVYRFEHNGWRYDQVYKEMKDYDFSSLIVHRRFKTFIKDYAKMKKAETSDN